ncbi:site-specific integrase [Streptomyces sp. BHT-5-2]|uniref:site-specific integrase n=1 Tax=Streptomyces sp. BHT-5-2 TaxID=2866715 RepID=UPI0028C4DCCC|nr:site-specific integrase [Streptomyces sp. BHT-5-2]
MLVPHYTPHSMRHTCASWLVQKGVSLYEVQHLLGHESFQTTQRYAHRQPDARKAVLDAWQRMETLLAIAS